MNGKLAYIVRGSEDGNLGIYTTKERARKKAIEYLTQNDPLYKPTILVTRPSWREGDPFDKKYNTVVASGPNVSRALDSYLIITIDGPHRTSADIEGFYINF